jgi:hypothetical protein
MEGEQKKEITMILAMPAAVLPMPQIAAISGKTEAEVRVIIAVKKG